MNKKLIISLEVIIIVVLMTSLVGAEDKMIGYGGINYNDYSEADSSELGFYAGVNNWLAEDYAVGVEMEFLEYSKDYTTDYIYDQPEDSQSYDNEIDYEAVGLLGTFIYDLEKLENINLYSKAGLYQISVESDSEIEFGGKIGVAAEKEIKDNLKLNGRVGYRLVDRFEGLETGLDLRISF